MKIIPKFEQKRINDNKLSLIQACNFIDMIKMKIESENSKTMLKKEKVIFTQL